MKYSKEFMEKYGHIVLKRKYEWNFIQSIWYRIDWRNSKLINLQKWFNESLDEFITNEEFIHQVRIFTKIKDVDERAVSILRYVKNRIDYKGDTQVWKVTEKWQTPLETFTLKTGDCFAGYEKLHTEIGVQRIDDLKVGNNILSYDFKNKKYVYKKIIKHWSKGKLQVNRVHLRNGQWFDVSEEHPMWCRIHQKNNGYEKIKLSDIDLTRWWKRKIPIAIKIPYNKSIPDFPKELYRVIGHFVAEGWTEKYKVSSSGYELIEEIIPILEKYDIPFTEYKNNSGVPCINFRKSIFKEYIKLIKKNSFNINLYEKLIVLPPEYLEELLHGMWLGDGTKKQYPDKRGFKNNKEWIYSTSSEQLARDIQRIGLHLGRTFHIWKQEHHGGVGTKPIYRITYNPKSFFLTNHGFNDVSEVSISHIEKLGKVEMYDITVEDTHTVIFENGVITHQCEDGALLIGAFFYYSNIPEYQWEITCGSVKTSSRALGGHCYFKYSPLYDGQVRCLDWCYYYSNRAIKYRKPLVNDNRYVKEWFCFNNKKSWKRIKNPSEMFRR